MKTFNPEHYEQRKEKFLKVALHLFADKGYAETSLAQIASSCHLQKPILYHYFKDKADILREVIRRHWKNRDARRANIPEGATLEESLTRMGLNYLAQMEKQENRDYLLLIYRNASVNRFLRDEYFSSRDENLKKTGLKRCRKLIAEKKGQTPETARQAMFQFRAALMRYVLEAKIWKAGFAVEFDEKIFVKRLAKIYARGV